MRTLTFATLLTVSATLAFAQQPATPPSATPPPATTPAQTSPDQTTATPAQTTPPSASGNDSNASVSKPDAKAKAKADKTPVEKADSIPSPGDELDPHIKKGSEDDVDAGGKYLLAALFAQKARLARHRGAVGGAGEVADQRA